MLLNKPWYSYHLYVKDKIHLTISHGNRLHVTNMRLIYHRQVTRVSLIPDVSVWFWYTTIVSYGSCSLAISSFTSASSGDSGILVSTEHRCFPHTWVIVHVNRIVKAYFSGHTHFGQSEICEATEKTTINMDVIRSPATSAKTTTKHPLESAGQLWGSFKKFCNLTIKKNENVTNYILFFNIIPTEFNAFATFFWQTVNSTKIEIFRLSLQTASLGVSSSG